jgi:hypothetical protein
MSVTVCLAVTNCLSYLQGGGHLWVFLNWALGLSSAGARVILLEAVSPRTPAHELNLAVTELKRRMEHYGLAESLALCSSTGEPLPRALTGNCLDLDDAVQADLLLNIRYSMPPEIVARFRRKALLDIDPGLLQIWVSLGQITPARHDIYFTIGETVGRPGTPIPDVGVQWHYTPPCVALNWWPVCPPGQVPFTTVSHWYQKEWMVEAGECYSNDKRSGFLPYLDLPRQTRVPLELALCLGADETNERGALRERGWGVQDSAAVTSTPWDYQHYIQSSRGEFSCVKPSCVRLQNAWISDRTICFLASGKPAVVQHTGPSRFLPDAAGLHRFRNLAEAAHCLEAVMADYKHQCRLARSLAEEYFDARKVAQQVLERALA